MDKDTYNSIATAVSIRSGLRRGERHALLNCLESALSLPGDIAECGVWKGGTAGLMLELCRQRNSNKTVHLFDAFNATDGFPDVRTPEEISLLDKRLANFRHIASYDSKHVTGLLDQCGLTNYEVHQGLFSNTLPKFHQQLCLIHGDADLYQSMVEISELAKRLLVKGGYYLVHDYAKTSWFGVKKAIDETINFDYYNILQTGHQLILQRKE